MSIRGNPLRSLAKIFAAADGLAGVRFGFDSTGKETVSPELEEGRALHLANLMLECFGEFDVMGAAAQLVVGAHAKNCSGTCCREANTHSALPLHRRARYQGKRAKPSLATSKSKAEAAISGSFCKRHELTKRFRKGANCSAVANFDASHAVVRMEIDILQPGGTAATGYQEQ